MKLRNKHRVRFAQHSEYDITDEEKIFWKVADLLQPKEEFKWAQQNNIELHYEVHDDTKWHGIGSQVLVYADLNSSQYSDYILNFYEFESTDWK